MKTKDCKQVVFTDTKIWMARISGVIQLAKNAFISRDQRQAGGGSNMSYDNFFPSRKLSARRLFGKVGGTVL